MNQHHINAINTINIEISALEFGKKNISSSFAAVVELIKDCVPPGRVVVMGMGKSGHIGNKIAATLASTGTPAFFVHPAEAGHRAFVRNEDCLKKYLAFRQDRVYILVKFDLV